MTSITSITDAEKNYSSDVRKTALKIFSAAGQRAYKDRGFEAEFKKEIVTLYPDLKDDDVGKLLFYCFSVMR